jgi:hypothetical protein
MTRNVPRSLAGADKPNRLPLYLAGGGVLLLLGCFVCTGGAALTWWLVHKSDRDKTAAKASKKTAKELIVGRWETPQGAALEFTQDGRLILSSPGDRPETGSYVVLDETTLELTKRGETIKVTFSVSETELTMRFHGSSRMETFKRAR